MYVYSECTCDSTEENDLNYNTLSSHIDPLFKELGILKLQELNTYVIGKFMFRWYDNDLPNLFSDKFEFVKNIQMFMDTIQDRNIIASFK